jgi:gamma-glutamyltranspeptidase
MQPMLHVQLVRNLIDCGMNPQESLDAPRWFLHGTGATQSEQDMRHSSVLLEEGYGGKWDGQQLCEARDSGGERGAARTQDGAEGTVIRSVLTVWGHGTALAVLHNSVCTYFVRCLLRDRTHHAPRQHQLRWAERHPHQHCPA